MADYLLRADKITGSIHAGFVSATDRFPSFIGVDDRAHYDANAEAYKQSLPLASELKENLPPEKSARVSRAQRNSMRNLNGSILKDVS